MSTATAPRSALAAPDAALKALAPGEATVDRIRAVKLSSITLPLATPISDAKVLTGRQKPMTEVAFLFAEIRTEQGHRGHRVQLLQACRRPGAVRPRQGDRAGADRRGPQRHRPRSGPSWCGPAPRSAAAALATQAIAAIDIALWDLKAKRAGLPLAKLLGAHRDSVRTYNTSGGFLHTPIEEVLENAVRVVGQRHRRHQDQGRAAGLEDRHRPGGARSASTSATTCR